MPSDRAAVSGRPEEIELKEKTEKLEAAEKQLAEMKAKAENLEAENVQLIEKHKKETTTHAADFDACRADLGKCAKLLADRNELLNQHVDTIRRLNEAVLDKRRELELCEKKCEKRDRELKALRGEISTSAEVTQNLDDYVDALYLLRVAPQLSHNLTIEESKLGEAEKAFAGVEKNLKPEARARLRASLDGELASLNALRKKFGEALEWSRHQATLLGHTRGTDPKKLLDDFGR